jgi:hypothetical protein
MSYLPARLGDGEATPATTSSTGVAVAWVVVLLLAIGILYAAAHE